MKAAILDEYLVCMHPRYNYSREIDAGAPALQGLGIGARLQRFGLQRDSSRIEKGKVRLVADKCENEIIL